jgi:hypothetical protein
MTDDVRQIPLTHGKIALVDAADYERVAAHEWSAVRVHGRWYATRDVKDPKRRQLLLHRFIFGAAPRVQVGFVNGDSLDCRRRNLQLRRGAGRNVPAPLREAFPRESLPVIEAKTPPRRRYVGIVPQRNGSFGASITLGRTIRRWLGTYATERDAALAVNVGARLLRGVDRRFGDVDVNDVPPAVPLDELEAAARALACGVQTERESA